MRAQSEVDDDSDSDGEPFNGMIVDDGSRATQAGDLLTPDSSGEGFASFYAAPTGAQRHSTIRRACAVREPNGNKHAKMLRFYFNLPSNISGDLNKWVGSTKIEGNVRDFFNMTHTEPWCLATRQALAVICIPLTRG